MLYKRCWLYSIIGQQNQEHYINLQMDQLDNWLTTHPIDVSWEISIKPYPKSQFGSIDDPDRQFGEGSELLIMLATINRFRIRTKMDWLTEYQYGLAGWDSYNLGGGNWVIIWDAAGFVDQASFRGPVEGHHWVNMKIPLNTVIEQVWICTWRCWYGQFEDTLGGWDPASWEIYLGRVFEPQWKCTWRVWWNRLRVALGDNDWAGLELYLEAVIKQVVR